ncbi:DUF4294 domain-containing protein [Odoribacter sp. OttesenSCG-928-L07]|nr:DUF4294 domain-containing protein [Odoribacter sp. OttesenSCG-928-L07]
MVLAIAAAMKKNLLILFLLFTCRFLSAQDIDSLIIAKAEVNSGDTLIQMSLPGVTIYPEKIFKNNREYVQYTRLMHNVKKVYPYAKLAGEKLKLYAPILDTLETKRERDKYFDIIEDELWAEYGSTLKDFTVKQGAILIKLVDRECQRSTYQVLKDFRGGFSAFFYQAFARIWGFNLKTEYDANGADADIEDIVMRIEAGAI